MKSKLLLLSLLIPLLAGCPGNNQNNNKPSGGDDPVNPGGGDDPENPGDDDEDEEFNLTVYFFLDFSHSEVFEDAEGNTINIIPYTILCDDWRYFCLENAGQFLDGYPNDGSVIVDTNTMKIVDYNTTPTTKAYFTKLNEEYKKGIIDKEFATQTYDE